MVGSGLRFSSAQARPSPAQAPGFQARPDPENTNRNTELFKTISVADLYWIQKLNLDPSNYSDAPQTVTLHDVENALSEVVASMFWTCHIPPTHQINVDSFGDKSSLSEVKSPFFLQQGNITVTEMSLAARLDLSIIAISAGLAASIVLLLLSVPLSLFHAEANKDEQDIPMEGTGFLHAIWLYRNHPELDTLLEQVEHPTDDNLRYAGMVPALS
ncbi:hypothetical protein B0H11DRAFT_2228628 [Mycena galericulata]|nr:hypothetical protein B0H11DRAFT_2228628 [Mycena galericulata]